LEGRGKGTGVLSYNGGSLKKGAKQNLFKRPTSWLGTEFRVSKTAGWKRGVKRGKLWMKQEV